MVKLLCLVFIFAACADTPVEPEPWPQWCSPEAYELAGQWERRVVNRDHSYRMALAIAEQSPCVFEYGFVAYQLADSTHAMIERLYESRGVMVVADVATAGPVKTLTIERQRSFVETITDSVSTIDDAVALYDTEQAKIWGDVLHLWGFQYTRLE